METATIVLSAVFFILYVLLLYKIWVMCSNVEKLTSSITGLLDENKKLETRENALFIEIAKEKHGLEVGVPVTIIENGKEVKIKEIKKCKFECYSNNYLKYEGSFNIGEIKKL